MKPEVTLGDYKGVEVPKSEIAVTDEEVDAEVKKEQDKNARTVAVEDRAAANGDITTIDFEGFVDGVAFEGGKGTDYALTLGSGTFIPGFEDQLVGANTGDHVEVKVTFPEEYQAKELGLARKLYSSVTLRRSRPKRFRSLTMSLRKTYLNLILLLSTKKMLRRN